MNRPEVLAIEAETLPSDIEILRRADGSVWINLPNMLKAIVKGPNIVLHIRQPRGEGE